MCVGAVAGLATITPAAGFVQPEDALIFGFAAALICYRCCQFAKNRGVDDALDC